MTIKELKEKYGMNSRVWKVECYSCGKGLEVPNMYREKDRKLLEPYCCAATVLVVQWLLHHGWHVTTYEANPPGAYYCPDCFPKGQPEYTKRPYGLDWCNQAEAWMKENNGKQ